MSISRPWAANLLWSAVVLAACDSGTIDTGDGGEGADADLDCGSPGCVEAEAGLCGGEVCAAGERCESGRCLPLDPCAGVECSGRTETCAAGVCVPCTSDGDGDGADACSDCDDTDSTKWPGAPERCDGLDQSCDGVVDEGADCPCALANRDGRAYLFCPGPATWAAARTACQALGYELVVIDDRDEDDWLLGELRARSLNNLWIGCSDQESEGAWRWFTGEPLGYAGWIGEQPNDGGGAEDCGLFRSEGDGPLGWYDGGCEGEIGYLCESPPPQR